MRCSNSSKATAKDRDEPSGSLSPEPPASLSLLDMQHGLGGVDGAVDGIVEGRLGLTGQCVGLVGFVSRPAGKTGFRFDSDRGFDPGQGARKARRLPCSQPVSGWRSAWRRRRISTMSRMIGRSWELPADGNIPRMVMNDNAARANRDPLRSKRSSLEEIQFLARPPWRRWCIRRPGTVRRPRRSLVLRGGERAADVDGLPDGGGDMNRGLWMGLAYRGRDVFAFRPLVMRRGADDRVEGRRQCADDLARVLGRGKPDTRIQFSAPWIAWRLASDCLIRRGYGRRQQRSAVAAGSPQAGRASASRQAGGHGSFDRGGRCSGRVRCSQSRNRVTAMAAC